MTVKMSGDWRWKVTSFDDDIEVHENMASENTYILGCTCPDFDREYQNCYHVKHVIERRYDAEAWQVNKYPGNVFVPVFDDFGVMVELGHDDEATMWTVRAHLKGQRSDSYRLSDSIGFITPGEGRRDIRNLVLEWLHGQYQLVPPCSDQAHYRTPFSKDEKKRMLDATNPKVVKDVYALLSEGICFGCKELESISVPEI